MAKSINMVWGPHIARVKTKNILNLRIGLFKTPLSYVELIVLRIDYLQGPLFVRFPLLPLNMLMVQCPPPPPKYATDQQ